MRLRFLLFSLLIPLAPWYALAADAPRAGAESRPSSQQDPLDEQDVVFYHATRPVLLRLHIRLDGQPFQTRWDESLHALFQYLDVNGDGVLSKAELEHAPSAVQLRQQLQGATTLEPEPAPDFAEVDQDRDGKVTLRELQAYYRHNGVGPLQLQALSSAPAVFYPQAPDTTSPALTEALFRALDRNKDGKLSREELEHAVETLHRLDLDDDEMITPEELFVGQPRFTAPAAPSSPESPFVLIHAEDAPGWLAQQLLSRYDKDRDGKLSRTEVGFDKELFDRLDSDHDGRLSAAELAAWARQPPDVELRVELTSEAAKGGGPTVLSPEGRGRPLLSGLRRDARTGWLVIALQDTEVEVMRGDFQKGVQRARQSLKERFRGLDANRDGYLDGKEIFQEPFDFVPLLRLADRDGDGRISTREFDAYLELQEKSLAAATLLTVSDRGRTLFPMLDTDHDGRLSVRELRAAWARMSGWDRDGDGCIGKEEVPRQFELIVSQGLLSLQPDRFAAGGFAAGGMPGRPHPVIARRGPVWFQKMDRNGDGDVSRREFLGTDEEFRRIDTDGDGLISVEEAERYDALMRKQKEPPR